MEFNLSKVIILSIRDSSGKVDGMYDKNLVKNVITIINLIIVINRIPHMVI